MQIYSPASSAIRVYVVPLQLPTTQCDALERLLSRDEMVRADRFILPDIRRRFVVCRGALRQLLGKTLGVEGSQLRFGYGQWGKPKLEGPAVSGLHFNVSHSDEWGLIAIGPRPVGIDLEVPNRRINYRAIASQVLSPTEKQAWEHLPPKEWDTAIMRLWVCKEALLKAMGLGIAEGLQQVSFPTTLPDESGFQPLAIGASLQLHVDDDGSCRMTHWTDATAWQLRMLQLIPDSHAALCCAAQLEQIEVATFTAEG